MRIVKYVLESGESGVEFINVSAVSYITFSFINFIFILIVPLLTMRLYAEEKKNGTMELIMTSPITTLQVLLGKFFSCLTIYTLMVMLTVSFMVILTILSDGQLDLRPVISSYCGTILMGAAIIPVGIFFSSLTENQIVSAFMSLSILLALWILIYSSDFFSFPYNEIVAFLSISEHLDSFKRGFIGMRHVVYYVSMSIFWITLSWMSVESTRWRQ
jgi:ABC-2 type transport system permease protein